MMGYHNAPSRSPGFVGPPVRSILPMLGEDRPRDVTRAVIRENDTILLSFRFLPPFRWYPSRRLARQVRGFVGVASNMSLDFALQRNVAMVRFETLIPEK